MWRWRRVDPWGLRQALTGFMVLSGALLASVVTVSILREVGRGGSSLPTVLQMAGALAFLAVWLTFAVRLYLTGIYRSAAGLRLRYIFSSGTVPWVEVTGFEARPALFLGEPTVRDAAWVLTLDGAVETPVQRRSSVAGWRKNGGPVLSTSDFDRMMDQLRQAREGQPGGGVVLR